MMMIDRLHYDSGLCTCMYYKVSILRECIITEPSNSSRRYIHIIINSVSVELPVNYRF